MKFRSVFQFILGVVLLSSLLGIVGGATPVRADLPAGLSAADWKKIQALLPHAQQAYLKASNTGANDRFGYNVAAFGDTVVVGASLEDSNAVGIDGNQSNDSAADSGAVYVFIRSGGVWSQQAYLKASNAEAGDGFGQSVAIDGDTIVVGAIGEDSNATGVNGSQADNSASFAGAAYVFIRSGGVWSQQAYLKASTVESGDYFGSSVAISGDTIVVGATGEDSNATGVNGTQANNSASASGAAYVFTRSAGVWSQQAYLKASNTGADDQFSYSVGISGDTILVSAVLEDSGTTGVNGNQADESAFDSGAVYVFTRSVGVWSQQAYLKAFNTGSTDRFGWAVAISGDTAIISSLFESSISTGVNGSDNDLAMNSGAAYVFIRNGGVWSQQAYLKASNTEAGDQFGRSVAIDGDTLVVGALLESSGATGVNGDQGDNSTSYSGAAYVFTRSSGVWSQQAYLKASNTEAGDRFGQSAALSGDTIVVGANWEASNATGVNGNQADNSAASAGAAYVYVIPREVTFNANGGTGSMSAQSANIPTALTSNTFTRLGYTFSGWNTAANGSGTSYADGALYNFTADITLYAQWIALPNHTVTFNSNGGTGSMSAQSANIPTALISNTFTRPGYVFSGWNTVADGTGLTYANGAIYDFSANITLYAQWTISNHTVTFNANGGTGSMSAQSANIPTALTSNAFTRPGYAFSGWNTEANGSGIAYANSASYDFTADLTLYAQWTLSPTFVDVPFDYWAWQWIESIYSAGITGGCSTTPLNYCPTQVVTRAQMAVFVLKGIHGSSFTPPAATGTVFGDVPASHWAAAWIEQFAKEGITAGCGNGNYCPDQTATTRAQMAVFLLRAKYGAGYVPPAVGAGTGFSDVPADYWAAAWIKQFAAEGITGGCGGGNYCPEGSLTRDQMAVFLQRTFNLPLP